MNDVCVMLRDGDKTKSVRIHKTMLNAFHDIRWYGEDDGAHPLMALFDGPDIDPEETFEYGVVVIDRNTRWVGSFQKYMAMGWVGAWGTSQELAALSKYDLDDDLGKFERDVWGQLLVHPQVRLSLLARAYKAGAVRRVKAAKLDTCAPWLSLEHLGLDTLPKALDWLRDKRKELSAGDCVILDCGLEFDPDNWTIVDYDINTEQAAFVQALSVRGFVEPMSDTEANTWLSRFMA